MRLNHMVKQSKATDDFISNQSLRDLTEGLSSLSDGSESKKLFSLLKTMIILAHRNGRNLLKEDLHLLTKVVRLLCDFKVKPGVELYKIIQDVIGDSQFTGLSELSYLAMCCAENDQSYLSADSKAKILD